MSNGFVGGEAVRRYKELAAGNDEAVRRMRAHDEAGVQALRRELAAAWQRLSEASERERVARAVSRAYWESAVEELWKERWLRVPPPPTAIPVGPNLNLLQCDAEVERTHDALHEALRRQPLLPRRREAEGPVYPD